MSTTAGTWLVSPERRALTPHRNAARPARPFRVDLVVVHYTATPHRAGTAHRGSDFARQMAWLRGERGKTSTHLDVLRDGVALQGAPLEDRTWHAGGSVWTAPDGTKPPFVNHASIGLDLDNVGRLYETPGGLVDSYEWDRMHTAPGETKPNRRRRPVHRARTFHTGPTWQAPAGTWWEAYTVPQIRATLRLVAELRDLYPQLADVRRWVGHEHIRATKSDPGPAFPWGLLRAVAERPHLTPDDAAGLSLAPLPGIVE
jgi:N-acetyl-anhydromuramyl-L-alanine amidase AmpD